MTGAKEFERLAAIGKLVLVLPHANADALKNLVRELSLLIKNILICVLKMNEGLTGLEQHEGEKLMTEFSF